MEKMIKVEGENRIIINGVVDCVRRLLKTESNREESKSDVYKKVMEALKTNGIICAIYEMVLRLENE